MINDVKSKFLNLFASMHSFIEVFMSVHRRVQLVLVYSQFFWVLQIYRTKNERFIRFIYDHLNKFCF